MQGSRSLATRRRGLGGLLAAGAGLVVVLAAPVAGARPAPGPGRSAAALDPGVSSRCRALLGDGVAAAFCDPAPHASIRLAARGRRAAAGRLYGAPLRPGATVTLSGARRTRTAQVVLLFRRAGGTEYVRFSRFPDPRGRAARIESTERRGGRLVVRMRVRGRTIRPALQRATPDAAARPAPTPEAAPAPAAPSVVRAPDPIVSASPAVPAAPTAARSPLGGGGCASPDPQLASRWDGISRGYIAGDGAISTALPDGRALWLFGDSFLGSVSRDGTRAPGTRMVSNALVVDDGSQLTTVWDPARAASAFAPPESDQWYWPADATVEGDKVRVFVHRMARDGATGAWGFRELGTDVVTLALPDLHVEATTPLTAAGPGGVAWGAAVLEAGPDTYIYGVEDDGWDKYIHLARAPAGGVLGPWMYWTGTGWSPDAAASARLVSGVSDQFSVLHRGGDYLLVSQVPMGRDIVVWRSSDPTGPWAERTTVYTTPTWGPGSLTYNAAAHPELNRDGDLVLTYNVNTDSLDDAFGPGSAYRPHFVRVPASCLPS